MASLLTVRLDKGASPNLGFRLQGGKDFGTPLVIQKVNGGSPAERAGLIAGDSVIKINETDVFNLRHKDAQDVIVRAGPAFEVTVQRGGSVWKPSVIPTGPLPSTPSSLSSVTKTSLAANTKSGVGAIGTGHNVSAKPFNTQVNGAVNGAPKLVNNQYNSPVKLYSEQSIAETLSAQTEVLSTGALGVNFKKNEKNYDATNSAVYRMLQEAENDPRTPEAEPDSEVVPAGIAGLRHVTAPETKPAAPTQQLPPGQNICADCERLIVGVFVRIKDKNLHVECFKCSTCGSSLKNVGYYNINNKLYCDVHAKLAARNNPPAPNLVPITVPPGANAPASAISTALATHSLPSPSPLSPKTSAAQPFQLLATVQNTLALDNFRKNSALVTNSTPLSYSTYLSKGGAYSTIPKPFSSVSAPASQNYSTLPKTAPLSPVSSAPAPTYSPVSSTDRSVYSFVWPPPPDEPEAPTASPLYVPPETHLRVVIKPPKTEEEDEMEYAPMPKLSLCSQEICSINSKTTMECVETISGSLETQKLVTSVIQSRPEVLRPPSPPPIDQDIAPTSKPDERPEGLPLKKPTEYTPNTIECKLKSQVENTVPQKWESSMVQALTLNPDLSQIPKKVSSSPFASALSIAPSQPFAAQPALSVQHIPLPEETIPYFPPEHPLLEEAKLTKVEETKTAAKPPVKKKKSATEDLFKDLPKSVQRLTLRDALTFASDRPFSPFPAEPEQKPPVKEVAEDVQKPLKPAVLPTSFRIVTDNRVAAPKPFPLVSQTEEIREEKLETKSTIEKHQTQKVVEEVEPAEKIEGMYPLFKGFSCSFGTRSEHSEFSVEIETSSPVINLSRTQTPGVKISENTETLTEEHHKEEKKTVVVSGKEEIVQKPAQKAITLHKPDALPQYQVHLSEDVEAELQMLEKAQALGVKPQMVPPKAPVIMIQPGDCPPSKGFKPVSEDLAPSTTFSPRPRPVTPSMINKPPPTLPYYQASLVAQECRAVSANLLDPASPAVSRSPSPCLERRSPSPFHGPSEVRPKSPAAGPPPNPLQARSVPTRADFKRDEAKRNITSYIPQYQSNVQKREALGLQVQCQNQNPQCQRNVEKREVLGLEEQIQHQNSQYQSNVQKREALGLQMQSQNQIPQYQSNVEKREVLELQQQNQRQDLELKGGMSIATLEASRADYTGVKTMSQNESVQNTGLLQIQRKTAVVEEFEHERKEKLLQVETKSVHPFHTVNNPQVEAPGVMGLHVTNPQPIISPFLQTPQVRSVMAPNPNSPIHHVRAPPALKPNKIVNKSNIPVPNTGAGGRQTAAIGVSPKRGRGILNTAALGGARVALCASCHTQIRGPFITALGKIWCPDHFICATPSCRRPLQDLGFVEDQGKLYCEYCFEQYLAPICSKCNTKIKGDCLKAIGRNFHPECFNCIYCGKLFGNSPFFIEDGNPYCEADWNELFTTKCFACGFPVEAGDRWVEALNNNYHSQCFNCTMCKKNLEGQSFFAKGGRPFCKNHAR